MIDKLEHLDQLKIDRSRRPSGAGRGITILLLLLIVIGAGGAGAYYYWQANAGLPIHVLTVSQSGGGGAGLDASGYVVPQRRATLSAQILGRVVYLNAEEGQRVKAGDVVARLDDSNYAAVLKQALAQQRQAKVALEDAAPIYARYQRLQGQNAISIDAFENQRAAYDAARAQVAVTDAAVEMARTNQAFTVVRSPFAGVVTQKLAQIGDVLAPTAAGGGDTKTGIATIVDMTSLEVEVDVSENYIDRVHPGQGATVTLNAYPEWQIPASVITVIPTADQAKGTVKVRIAIKTQDARVLPQMGARVTFLTGDQPTATTPVITLPLAAVSGSGPSGTVFLVQGDSVQARPVKLGLRTADSVTVLSGISAGDRIAADGLDKLKDGAKIRTLE